MALGRLPWPHGGIGVLGKRRTGAGDQVPAAGDLLRGWNCLECLQWLPLRVNPNAASLSLSHHGACLSLSYHLLMPYLFRVVYEN